MVELLISSTDLLTVVITCPRPHLTYGLISINEVIKTPHSQLYLPYRHVTELINVSIKFCYATSTNKTWCLQPWWYLITALAQIITYDNYDWKTILVLTLSRASNFARCLLLWFNFSHLCLYPKVDVLKASKRLVLIARHHILSIKQFWILLTLSVIISSF